VVRVVVGALIALALQDRAEHIERSIDWVVGPDPELREMGREQLMRHFGREALPALEKRLERMGALEVAKLWRDVGGIPSAPGWVKEEELEVLPDDDPALAQMRKIDRSVIEAYVKAKYAEAIGFVHKKQYQRAYDLGGALLALEPRSAVAESVRKLRRHCDAMILQTTLLEARLVHAKPAYLLDEPVELTLRAKNIFRSEIRIGYDRPEPGKPVPPGVVLLEIATTVRDLYGASQTWTRSQEVSVEGDIPVAPGGQWERSFTLDTATEIDDREHVREVVVQAWTAPGSMTVEGRDVTRRVIFEPAVLRLVPRKHERFVEAPLEWLKKTIASGTAQETFICSRLIPDADRGAALEALIDAMARTENRAYREALSWILKGMTGEALGPDPKKWREWNEQRGKPKK